MKQHYRITALGISDDGLYFKLFIQREDYGKVYLFKQRIENVTTSDGEIKKQLTKSSTLKATIHLLKTFGYTYVEHRK